MVKEKNKKTEKTKVLFTPITKVWEDEDEVGRVVFLPDVEVTVDGAKKHFEACEKLAKGKRHPVLVDLRNIKSVDHQARKYLAGDVATKLTKASAVLVGSPVSRVIGNFFIGLNKPPYPIKLFTSEPEAMEWLRRFPE